MGTMRHEAVIVTSPFLKEIEKAHKKAIEIFDSLVGPIIITAINRETSFYISPD